MRTFLTGTLTAAAMAVAIVVAGSGPASAQLAGARIANALEAKGSLVTEVQWRRRGWYGPGAGFAAGLLFGGALLGPRYYGYPVYPVYPYPYAAYRYDPYPSDYDDDVAYCIRRFKSYDVRSGTYLGFDGRRHPCP